MTSLAFLCFAVVVFLGVTADMLRDDPHGIVDMVRAAVEGAGQSGFFASGQRDISARIEEIVGRDEG